MAAEGRKCKTISFDMGDVFEAELLAYAENKGRFSRYIKRLIAQDKDGGIAVNMASSRTVIVESITEDVDAMESYL